MVPAGYMAKRVVAPEGMGLERVSSIYSVSGCIAENFTDYINYWQHNGYWFFDSPETIIDIARENRIELAGTVLFFYEVHELQFDGRMDALCARGVICHRCERTGRQGVGRIRCRDVFRRDIARVFSTLVQRPGRRSSNEHALSARVVRASAKPGRKRDIR